MIHKSLSFNICETVPKAGLATEIVKLSHSKARKTPESALIPEGLCPAHIP